jgi:3-deoxy-7-phosphoheptulonate synthase
MKMNHGIGVRTSTINGQVKRQFLCGLRRSSDVAGQITAGNGAIVGLMLESFLVAGRQALEAGKELTYGQSITDACIDWDTTVGVLERLAEAVRARRAAG